jgi:hypothetical protein
VNCCNQSCNQGRTCPARIAFAGKEPLDPRFCWAFLGFIAGSIVTVFVAQFFN